jgi:hypothetical protein
MADQVIVQRLIGEGPLDPGLGHDNPLDQPST